MEELATKIVALTIIITLIHLAIEIVLPLFDKNNPLNKDERE